jgi:hypothetical protein
MYAESNVVPKQLQVESRPSEARLIIGTVVGEFVVFTITDIAGKLQPRFASGSILGLTTVVPH